jgi:hypothetical protein
MSWNSAVTTPKRNRREPSASLRSRAAVAGAFVAVHQPCHGQRHVERVLQVVIAGVAGPVAGIVALLQPRQITEAPIQHVRRGVRIKLQEDAIDLGLDRLRIRGIDPVGHVEIVLALLHVCGFGALPVKVDEW